ncbi:hypothetical protein BZG01_16755 [Labilibaculum manganireducens]|uniref:NfeD-like C-terminal domain-containing protein n=1 Tax=Labilibaculum manganireducens TaxID=1940525 RepID=A0A2N3HY12_9BACT|nr:hypothetical protein [Labilibaculum manganireducens]PKQ62931.1 hypothetical protein BZG01_16755 [Labilibaculum manganireducens]
MILQISDWWSSMEMVEKIFWSISVPFSLLFLIQIVLTFVGGDIDDMSAEGDADAAVEGDAGIDFQFISLKNLIAFFAVFGWTGIICLDMGLGAGVSTLIATLAGLAMMLIMASILYFMGKLVEEGTLNINNAKGKIGNVYLSVPANRKGMGKVQIEVQGLQTLDAVTDSDSDIPTGAVIQVVDVLNDQILIVKPY